MLVAMRRVVPYVAGLALLVFALLSFLVPLGIVVEIVRQSFWIGQPLENGLTQTTGGALLMSVVCSGIFWIIVADTVKES